MDNSTCSYDSNNVVMFSTADWDERYWTNKQHTACELAKCGWNILYVESIGLRKPKLNSSLDYKRVFRRLANGLRSLLQGPIKRSENIWVLSPLVIPGMHKYKFIAYLNDYLLSRSILNFSRCQKFEKPVVWTYHPFILLNIEVINPVCLVYHCVDDLSALPDVDSQLIRYCEKKLIKQSDLIFVTSKSLYDYCLKFTNHVYYFPNVVDVDHFSISRTTDEQPVDLENIPEPRLVYHGVLSDFKVDFKLLYQCALMEPKWHWVFIGEQREGQNNNYFIELSKLANVHLIGYRNYSDLPAYLRGMNVGLLPSLINNYTKSMFPMKYFEYIAAGLPVVSTPLSFLTDGDYHVEIADKPRDFIAAIRKALLGGKLDEKTVSCIIGENTWKQRTSKMINIVKTIHP